MTYIDVAVSQNQNVQKSFKNYRHKNAVLKELRHVVELLLNKKTIPGKYKDHELKGKYKGVREFHLKPDDLLLYIKKSPNKRILMAIGSYSVIISSWIIFFQTT